MGVARSAMPAVFRGLGLVLRRAPARDAGPPLPLDAAGATDAASLRAALRGHIARQIAGFDAALTGGGAAVVDSARVLRDLGGLKKLLDALGGEPADGRGDGYRDGYRTAEGGDADGVSGDLPALRAEIARRLGLAPAGGGAGAASAGPDPGARP